MVTGIYVRVSTDEQAREGYSIRAQEEKLRSYAALKNWHVYSLEKKWVQIPVIAVLIL